MPTGAASDDEESDGLASPAAARERRPRAANAAVNYGPTHHLQRTHSVQPDYMSIHTHTPLITSAHQMNTIWRQMTMTRMLFSKSHPKKSQKKISCPRTRVTVKYFLPLSLRVCASGAVCTVCVCMCVCVSACVRVCVCVCVGLSVD